MINLYSTWPKIRVESFWSFWKMLRINQFWKPYNETFDSILIPFFFFVKGEKNRFFQQKKKPINF